MTDISVLIPAYNAADTLSETLDSVACQTCKRDVEIIVVDDGSQDDTLGVASAHISGPNVIRTDNRGAPAAINTGFGASKGQFICVLDADDVWLQDKLELQCAHLEAAPHADIVFGFVEAFECPSIPKSRFTQLTYQKGAIPGPLFGTSMAHRKVFLDMVGPLDEALRYGYWADWYQRLLASKATVEMMEDVVLHRRIRPGTLSQRVTGRSGEGISGDLLKIARQAMLAKRKTENRT